MGDFDVCTLKGNGKYLLLSAKVGEVETYFLRGGVGFEMHKDIFAEAEVELGIPVYVYGGGRVEINESTSEIIFSGSSQRYGGLTFPEKVKKILEVAHPEWSVVFR